MGACPGFAIRSSLARWPHHRSFRTTVIVLLVWSTLSSLKGPAVVSGFWTHPVLKTAGLLFVEAG